LLAQPQAQVGRDLVVSRARRVQPLAGIAGERGEALFDVEVHVLGVERPGELAGGDLLADLRQALLDRLQVAPGENAARSQHPRVRQRRRDILLGQPLIERYGSREALDLLVNGLREAAGPGLRLLRHNFTMRLNTAL